MKYYLIAGEASGDLHASRLMQSLRRVDGEAEFRFFGGDLMSAAGGMRVRHYRDLAYMGFVPVLLHLRTIFRNMAFCKRDIIEWHPDVVILVDYPGFNLDIAKFLHAKTSIPAYYYISPKIWAWKEYRIKNIKRDVSELFSILPFEVPFFEGKHGYKIHYVGNPTADEVSGFLKTYTDSYDEFCSKNGLDSRRPVIALLAGSRKQEIKDNLPAMIEAASRFADKYQLVVAGAPSISADYYARFISGQPVKIVYGQTYELLAHSRAAVVTSGTATLETALFNVPQVVCYETPIPKVIAFLRKHLLKVRYISLVNLIADREVVRELVADTFSVDNIAAELSRLLPDGTCRNSMLDGYAEVRRRLGDRIAPDNAAEIMVRLLKKESEE
ncbi:lipid-A-disaccharide synthase [uncultured Prevotella sp.]|uniref:lipid-A-disaccharide synthase n=1 Tax=uncultured Prevotella sp. TaxID=159272 RepID=UPI0025F5686D|nr:lipid-A-disaccharide synthase [uncultured Prevotella sp.]